MDSHSDLLVCPLCRRGYSLSGNNSSYRYPILLKCKHSICEYCFRDEAKNRRQVACRRCSFVSPIERNAKGKDKIDEYPIHFYIAGVLLQDKLNAIRATEAVDRIKFEEVESNSTQKFCDKCGKEKAIVKCDQCEDCFCDRCDVDIHTITTGARKHNRKRISTIPMSIAVLESQSLKCELHNTNIKYNCLDCNIKICSDCVLQSHKDHSYELLIQNNKLVLNKTLDLIDKAHELLPRFSYSQSKINEVFSKMEAKLSFNPRYSKTFETLFGSIQWCEFENRMKLKQFFNEQSEILKNYANQLLKRIDDIKEFVKLKAILNETYLEANKVNLNETVSLLENTIATPWFISNDIFEAIDSFTFEKYPVVSEKFVELNLDKFPKLTLKSIEEVSENDLQNIDMTVKKNELAKNRSIVSPENDNDRLSVTSNHSNETNGSLGSRKKSCNKDHQEQFHLFCPSIGKNSPVVISHMLSPASFYVHLLKNNQWFAEFKKRCENWALKTPFVCNVKKGDCCLTACLNEANQKEWRRVKVNGFKDDGKIMVTYIDYGHSGVLSLEDLKHTSESIRKTLSFAFKCSLKDTFSIQQNWTALNTQECMQIIQSYKQWNLNVIRKVDNSFVVDLLMYSENTGSRPASLHTVLLHTKKSVLYNNACKHPDKIVNADSGSDTDSESPLVIADEAETVIDLTSGHFPRIEVTILKSDSPDNIAFSLPHLHLELNEMSKDIQEFYSNSENLVLLDRYELKIGTLCLVHFQRTNKWCRGKVQKIDYERESVTVNFFDEGVKDEMSMSKIYKLDHRFSLSHSGAMHACIGGIQPPCKKDTWPKVVCERLEKLLTDNKIFMSKLKTHTEVELKTRAKNLLAVDFWFQDCNELAALEPSVYDWKSVRDILIKEGLGCEDPNFQLATTTDAESSKEEDGNSTKKPMNIIRIDDDLEMLIENESEQSLCVFKPKTFWLPPSRPKRRMFETVATFVDMGAHIFITDSEENLKNMSEIRAEFESNFKMFQNSKKTNWTVGEICSAFYFGDKQYHRAEVVSIDATNNFLVEFIDYGNIETCTYDDLREYVCAPHIPKQVCKCRHKDLENLLSPFEGNEQFIKDILDFVHATIVDKTVTVEYIGDVNGFPLIDICCFGDKLVDLVGEEVKRRKLKEEDKYLLIENNDIVVEIKFTYFISSSDVIIEMPKQYMIHDEKFEEMLDNLQLISRNLNKLTEIIVDKPCIAHDHETKKWHRAKIFKINKNFTGSVLVYFVDKGTISEIDQSLLRETREDLMRLPVKTFICRLTNLHKYETNKPIDSLEQIKECFSTEKVYEALIKDKSDEGVLRIEIINNNRSLLCLEQ